MSAEKIKTRDVPFARQITMLRHRRSVIYNCERERKKNAQQPLSNPFLFVIVVSSSLGHWCVSAQIGRWICKQTTQRSKEERGKKKKKKRVVKLFLTLNFLPTGSRKVKHKRAKGRAAFIRRPVVLGMKGTPREWKGRESTHW